MRRARPRTRTVGVRQGGKTFEKHPQSLWHKLSEGSNRRKLREKDTEDDFRFEMPLKIQILLSPFLF